MSNPNESLGKKISDELLNAELILPENKDKLEEYLINGTMKDSFWIAAFQKKINDINKPNET